MCIIKAPEGAYVIISLSAGRLKYDGKENIFMSTQDFNEKFDQILNQSFQQYVDSLDADTLSERMHTLCENGSVNSAEVAVFVIREAVKINGQITRALFSEFFLKHD